MRSAHLKILITGLGKKLPKTNNLDGISIICEIANAHEGSIESMYSLLRASDESDADWVKVQIYHFESLVAKENNTLTRVLENIEFSANEWLDILDYANKLKPKLMVEVFDIESLNIVKDHCAIKAFKIPTADIRDVSFIEAVCRIKKPVFVGVGGAKLEEIDQIYNQISLHSIDLTLLHGIQNFPTKLADSLLIKINLFRDRYKCAVGFADHIDAEDKEMSKTLPAMAVSAGASFIEKHITLDRSKHGIDFYSSLNPDEFKSFVKFIRDVYSAVGYSAELETLNSSETTYRNQMKKFAVLSKDASIGDLLDHSFVVFRRTSYAGITRNMFEKLEKKAFNVNLIEGTVLNESHFK